MALKDKLNETPFNGANFDDMCNILDEIEEKLGIVDEEEEG